jgi:hypothetical protein
MGLEPGRVPGRLDTLEAGGEFVGGAGIRSRAGRPATSGWSVSRAWAGLLSTTWYRLCPLPGMTRTRLNPASIDSNSAR